MSAVFDASVAVKWFVEDPLSDAAVAARERWGRPSAPNFVAVEVANALRRYVVRGELDIDLAVANVALVPRLMRLVDQRDYLEEALALGARRNHSVTDCLYAVLAMRQNLTLVTADQKMARKFADLDGLKLEMLVEPQ